ncbi:hypothetical protein L1887_39725 [Cichorium endivia]|nr:hypothetical protein L1887_39725 [Cichorium endivia]
MEKLPESLFADDDTTGASSSSHGSESSEQITQTLKLLNVPLRKKDAIEKLVNEGQICKDLPLLMWKSDVVDISTVLKEWMADHPDTKMDIVRAKLPVIVYPYMAIQGRTNHLEELRVESVGVLVRLLEEEETNTPDIIHFLLETKALRYCLECIYNGDALAKKAAIFIFRRISMSNKGEQYLGIVPERIDKLALVLRKTINHLKGKAPNAQLLKEVLMCFIELGGDQVVRELADQVRMDLFG